MSLENTYFDVTPRVLCADTHAEIVITPRFDHCRFDNTKQYEVCYHPTEEFAQNSGWKRGCWEAIRPVSGQLHIHQYFESEQEHVFEIRTVQGTETKPVGAFRVYSLHSDLYVRRPYKGDFHIHSSQSDGRESPAYVAAACRRIGLDFMAVTDHEKYAPSLEAQRAFNDVDIDLQIYPGEEVHPPDKHPVHMINFGGRFSINALFTESDYRESVSALQHRLPAPPPGVDAEHYAACVWCFDKIREAGGLGIFCHPYWFTSNRYTPAGALTSYLFETSPYDAFELIGGYFKYEAESNVLQVARYHEERAKGRTVPIVGSSDAHGCERGELFGWYYTIVFAPGTDLPDIIQSVKDGYSVAVEMMSGEIPRAHGPFRMVKYALFLLREVFPGHDALCMEEGRLMLEHTAGDPDAAPALARLKGRTTTYMDRCWSNT